MDLRLTAEQEEFRDEIRTWLRDNVPSETFAPPSTPEGLEQHRAWERKMYDAGFAAVHWPEAYGGRGLDPIATAIFYDEYVRSGAPDRLNRLGLGLGGPTIIEWGTKEQQDRWLTGILSCDDIWCQGFSEPSAGSDLARLQTKGELKEDGILVNGQKVWTSHSRFADWIFALVRTNLEAPRHKGITYVIIDMKDLGVRVQPIEQMNHAADFSEVFFENVLVPYENVVGEIDGGWTVAMNTLTHERGSGLNTAAHFHKLLKETVELIPEERRQDPRVKSRIGKCLEEIEAYRYMTLRTLSELTLGNTPDGVSYMGKIWWSQLQTNIFELGLDMLDDRSILEDEAPSNYRQRYWLGRAAHIYAGSNEIQRNIISERVLKLPKEPRNVV